MMNKLLLYTCFNIAIALGLSAIPALSGPVPSGFALDHKAKHKAETLIDALYDSNIGAQVEYLSDKRNLDTKWLAKYKRVWAYTQGITLANSARAGDAEKAYQIANWFIQTAISVTAYGEGPVFGGWHFSNNTSLQDNWFDVRLVTGANAWAVNGIGVYITSAVFKELSGLEQERIREFYRTALESISHNQRVDGLVTAGWTVSELVLAPRGEGYNIALDKVGYGAAVTRIKSQNVVTEHNLDMLALWNQSIEYANEFGLNNKDEYIERRNRLREAIFTKLYDEQNGRIGTGLVDNRAGGACSEHSAVDNASWLSLSVDFDDLSVGNVEKLGRALDFTIRDFAKKMHYKGDGYFGAHYFSNRFADPYVEPNQSHESAYNLEATAGLILGLHRFYEANPEHRLASTFRDVADHMWRDMQTFVRRHGCVYATKRIQYILTQLQSSTAAVWYLDVYSYYEKMNLLADSREEVESQHLAAISHDASTGPEVGMIDR